MEQQKFSISYGEGLRVPDLYAKLPDIDRVDPEFMYDVFYRAYEICKEEKKDPTAWELLCSAKRLTSTEFKTEFMHSKKTMHQLRMSLIDPGLEVMRYLPRIAQRLGMNVEREFKPLWEYVDPDFMMRLNFGHWNMVSHILDDLPELADTLKQADLKPTFFLMENPKRHGLTANILGDDIQLSLRSILDEHDVPNAQKFAGNLGPKILGTTDKWIFEEYLDYPEIERYDMFSTRQPYLYGNLMGATLSQIHATGFSYNTSLEEQMYTVPEDNRVIARDWCYARDDGQTTGDIQIAKNLLKKRYLRELAQPMDEYAHISSYGTQPYLQAFRGFTDGYNSGEHLPLVSLVR